MKQKTHNFRYGFPIAESKGLHIPDGNPIQT